MNKGKRAYEKVCVIIGKKYQKIINLNNYYIKFKFLAVIVCMQFLSTKMSLANFNFRLVLNKSLLMVYIYVYI